MVTHIEGNIYQISVRLPDSPLRAVNDYFIKGEDRNLLIDTGFRSPVCQEDLSQGLAELGESMDRTDIFLTHLHADHAGLAPFIIQRGGRIWLSEEDAGRLNRMNGEDGWTDMEGWYRESGFSLEEIAEAHQAPMYRYRSGVYDGFSFVRDGDCLEYGGHTLQAVATPGHTPGHMCLYDAQRQIMFLGDHVLFDITPNIISWPRFVNPIGTYLQSLRRIEDFPIRIALPAHRGTTGSVPSRTAEIREHHRRRLAETQRIVTEHPGETAYGLASNMTWHVNGCDGWAAFPISQKRFATGEAIAHLQYLNAEGSVEIKRDGERLLYYPVK